MRGKLGKVDLLDEEKHFLGGQAMEDFSVSVGWMRVMKTGISDSSSEVKITHGLQFCVTSLNFGTFCVGSF